eukprot:CAMPEP_0197317556 /NCGR_PEP_ID=MMETSP0891-20130614/47538_1 /TAXON_ID=44058 ORGANISM="Aureoumbra lagunensis, Strain CCMP1510" /NCGR_SAMPLE_ID=MMETSP0891 /ASSEMBLY_ACC=CAM_ASM_000534 /LENGTH=1078 /DNA_ID=CAMNT_0042807601 /DNA_START=304 /DNA_END=3540 /DNA_ORIENTATION=+
MRLIRFRGFGRIVSKVDDRPFSKTRNRTTLSTNVLNRMTDAKIKMPFPFLSDVPLIDHGPRIIQFRNKRFDYQSSMNKEHLIITSITESNLLKTIMDTEQDYPFLFISSSIFQANEPLSLMLPIMEMSSNLDKKASLLICDESRIDHLRNSGKHRVDFSFLENACHRIPIRSHTFSVGWICVPNIERLLSHAKRLRLILTLLSSSNNKNQEDFIKFKRRLDIPSKAHLSKETNCEIAYRSKLIKGWGLELPHTMICTTPSSEAGVCEKVIESTPKITVDIVFCAMEYNTNSTISMLRSILRAMPLHVRRRRIYYYQKSLLLDSDDMQFRQELERSEPNLVVSAIESLQDVGGCDHTYLHHIHRKYEDLGDVTLFSTDDYLAQMTNILAFARVVPPSLKVWCAREINWEQMSFELKDGGESDYIRAKKRTLGSWLANYGDPSSLLHGDLTMSNQIITCMGGIFAAGASAIRRTAKEIYHELLDEFKIGSSLEATHFMERSWFTYFGYFDVNKELVKPKQQHIAIYSGVFCDGSDKFQRTDHLVRSPISKSESEITLDNLDLIFFSNCEAIFGLAKKAGWKVEFYEPKQIMPVLQNGIFTETMLKTTPHRFEILKKYDLTLYVAPGRSVNLDALAYVVNFELIGTASIAFKSSRLYDPAHEHSILKAVRSWVSRPRIYINRDKFMSFVREERSRGSSITFKEHLLTDSILRRMTADAQSFGELWLSTCLNSSSTAENIALHYIRQHAQKNIVTSTAVNILEVDDVFDSVIPAFSTQISDPEPRTWVFIATAESSSTSTVMIKRAVTSANKNTNLRPICIFLGTQQAPLANWLSGNGVELIYHKPVWAWRIYEAITNIEEDLYDSYLYDTAENLLAAFMKIDISILLSASDVGSIILYTDANVLFCRTPTLADFGGKIPSFFTVGTEIDGIHNPNIPSSGSTGIMLMNLLGLRVTYDPFTEYVFETLYVNQDLTFGKYRIGDQGAFFSFYQDAFDILSWPSFNWKPYWPMTKIIDVSIVHFHGANTWDYEEYLFGNSKNKSVTSKEANETSFLLKKCEEARSGCHYWLDYSKSFDDSLSYF